MERVFDVAIPMLKSYKYSRNGKEVLNKFNI